MSDSSAICLLRNFRNLRELDGEDVPIRTAGGATRLADESSAWRSSGGGNLGVAGDRAAVHHGGSQGPLTYVSRALKQPGVIQVRAWRAHERVAVRRG